MTTKVNGMHVERFDCSDGAHHFSVAEDDTDELSTCVIHNTREAAELEMAQLASGVTEVPRG